MNIVGAAAKDVVESGWVVEIEEIAFLWNVDAGANDCPTERIAVRMTADTRTIIEIIVLKRLIYIVILVEMTHASIMSYYERAELAWYPCQSLIDEVFDLQ